MTEIVVVRLIATGIGSGAIGVRTKLFPSDFDSPPRYRPSDPTKYDAIAVSWSSTSMVPAMGFSIVPAPVVEDAASIRAADCPSRGAEPPWVYVVTVIDFID